MIGDDELRQKLMHGGKITITSREFPNLIDKTTKIIMEEEMIKFRDILIENMINELKSLPPSKTPSMKEFVKNVDDATPLREQIIRAINRDNKKGKSGIKVSGTGDRKKLSMAISIDHPLAAALNYGTGIYVGEGPITPKAGKKYLFIPGVEYALRYYEAKKIKPSSIRELRSGRRSPVTGKYT